MPLLERIDASGRVLEAVELGDGPAYLGRLGECAITITDDPQISRRHCAVAPVDGRWVLHDLKSRNGTFVGKHRVEAVKLRDQGVFRLGSTHVRFVERATVAAAPGAGEEEDEVFDVAVLVEGEAETADAAAAAAPRAATAPATARKVANAYGADSIQSLAKIGNDPGFRLDQMGLLNARSQVVHGEEGGGGSDSLMVLQMMLYGAARCHATDLHLEPGQADANLRMRIDGAMITVCDLPADLYKRIASLCKVLSDIDISQRAIVQEGHFSVRTPSRSIDYRVSFTPVMHGQKMVLRVLDKTLAPQTLESLGAPPGIISSLSAASEVSTGLMTVCGPTGSGKTTTLYAVLRGIDAGLRNVITIEDPIEYELEGVTQIPVDTERGHGFSALLRSCLRQDPDVIVLGEIRDQDTAVTAMQAATTGHLVLSTIHANDAIGTIFRLLDLGVEPYLVASTLNLVLAQRLVRTLCPHCKAPVELTAPDLARLGLESPPEDPVLGPVGCARCFATGYRGRTGVHELMTASDAIRDVVMAKPNIAQLKAAAREAGLVTLRERARELILAGETGIDEAHRVVGLI
ncbi:ATPase, T2SS/T4P/T4SS family [Phycisphaera mikurensis]|uniref:Putative type IV pilus assembly protein n=1 Tax=Phycisphaera mikurensis (strain NBRC 102666 / KCTC 22515 / FYK2301M01) TaxID=1142394 RepID=I0IAP2_PHYMF|nr:ATPase, T2SS/T4P/T4SS family [Phycisphaera mikurensis]MBB6441675.1 type II secretory ATPase GspE/PulE/Tfp pilus assembly ATPase PilB-like protein [Phycisphaera mikurensis]BAM02330.1 putative type IV pilus assembly protein [Phycisphaera mikurensis NBRC 102666]